MRGKPPKTGSRCSVQIGIGADYHCRLAAKFKQHAFQSWSSLRHDRGTNIVGAGKCHQCNARIGCQPLADRDPARDDIQHTLGQARRNRCLTEK